MILEWLGGPWDGDTFEAPEGTKWVETALTEGDEVIAKKFYVKDSGDRHLLVWSA